LFTDVSGQRVGPIFKGQEFEEKFIDNYLIPNALLQNSQFGQTHFSCSHHNLSTVFTPTANTKQISVNSLITLTV
jgi:hypothetical protein